MIQGQIKYNSSPLHTHTFSFSLRQAIKEEMQDTDKIKLE